MKRTITSIFAVMLALVMVLSLTACGDDDSSKKEESAVSKDVSITAENIEQYVKLSTSYGEFETSKTLGVNFADIDVILDTYLTSTGKLNNTTAKIEITCPKDWTVNSSDSAYNSSDSSKMVLNITFPADGKYTEKHQIGCAFTSSKPSADCTIRVLEASGTFVQD